MCRAEAEKGGSTNEMSGFLEGERGCPLVPLLSPGKSLGKKD